jgi:hypothetical protein
MRPASIGLALALAVGASASAQAAALTLCNRTGDRLYDLFLGDGQRTVPLGLRGIDPSTCATVPDVAPGAYDLHFGSDRGGLCVFRIAVSGAARIDVGPDTGSCIK